MFMFFKEYLSHHIWMIISDRPFTNLRVHLMFDLLKLVLTQKNNNVDCKKHN